MKNMHPSLLAAAIMITLCGCRVDPASYQANAIIQTRPRDPADRGELVIIPSELKRLEALALTVATGTTHRITVKHLENTDLIGVSLSSDDPQEAATLCNAIAEQFVDAAAVGDIERQLVEEATPPKKPIR